MIWTRYNANGELSEDAIQIAVMEWVNLHSHLKKYVLHIPNESKRSARYGKKLKMMGMRKGCADLFIAIPRKKYSGAWIEIKTSTGKLSKAQSEFLEDMKNENYFCAVTRGIKETIKVIHNYYNMK